MSPRPSEARGDTWRPVQCGKPPKNRWSSSPLGSLFFSFLPPPHRPRGQTVHTESATPIILLTWWHEATGRALGREVCSPGFEVRGRKGGNADAETSRRGFSFHYPGVSPRRRLPSQKAEAENIHMYLQLQYKRAANLMIRDYYLKGPTVTDLFVISCNNTDGNEFICINVSVTRTSVEILH